MRFEVLNARELDSGLVAVWQDLRARWPEAYGSPFFHPRFAAQVGAVRGDVRVVLGRVEGQVVLIWPVQGRGGVVRAVGAPLNDRHGPIVWREAFAGVPLARVAAQALAKLGEASTSLSGVPESLGLPGEAPQPAWRVMLEADPTAYWQARQAAGPADFKDMRRRARLAERTYGAVELVSAPLSAAGILGQVLALKTEQFRRTRRHDVLAPVWVRELLDRLAADAGLASAGGFGGSALALRAGDTWAAVEFNLRDGAEVHSWLAAYAPAFRNIAPGMMLLEQAIDHYARSGVAALDLGVGSDQYKTLYANASTDIVEATCVASGLRGALYALGSRAWAALEGLSAPASLAALTQRTRRRFNQLAALEPTVLGRLSGVATALTKGLRRS
jgi:CelD/BcsL family acetyltransferase involved in cellulose biosynthesis